MKRFKLALLVFAAFCPMLESYEAGGFEGLPPTRTYPFESIGAVSRGGKLGFDAFGRLVLVEEGTFAVLNDETWLNLAPASANQRSNVISQVRGPDGTSYFGSYGNWGQISFREDGSLEAQSFVSEASAFWTKIAVFEDLVATPDGVFFGSWNGLVYRSYDGAKEFYCQVDGMSELFTAGGRTYAATENGNLLVVDLETERLELALGGDSSKGLPAIESATELEDGRALLGDSEGGLWLFDSETLEPWASQRAYGLEGRICSVKGLIGGGVAVSISGKGLCLFDGQGRMIAMLDSLEYHRVYDMATNEKGVLWTVLGKAVNKIQYGSPLTEFGQRLGIDLAWPQIGFARDRMYVTSNGALFEASATRNGESSRFALSPEQPDGGAWTLVSGGGQALVGSRSTVFVVRPDGSFEPVAEVEDLLKLAMVGDELCFAMGRGELAVLGLREGRWIEVAPRSEGIAYAPIVHTTRRSVWVEMGRWGVARLWLEQGAIKRTYIPNSDWEDSWWVNVGSLDDLVILTQKQGVRRVFDESTSSWIDPSAVESLLNRSPLRIDRVAKDADGVIWGTHSEGVVKFVPVEGGYLLDSFGLDIINDRYPRIVLDGGKNVWIVAERSLLRVKNKTTDRAWRRAVPLIVSLVANSEGKELISADTAPASQEFVFPYRQNSLSLRFFSGRYDWRSFPGYEYKLGTEQSWTALGGGSSLALGNLREGRYDLQVRFAGAARNRSAIAAISFQIEPPWYRTMQAYFLYGFLAIGLIAVGVTATHGFARKRNRALELLVQKKTSQLRATMERLNEETRNSATLAERNRLACEIHDSLQQGIIGAIMQLDTTLDRRDISSEMRSRLVVVRNMVSFVKQELQHLVWDLDSTLSNSADLGEVLQGMAKVLCTPSTHIRVTESGEARPLPHPVRHNLLRIAQESSTNAIRHSGADRIDLHLAYCPDSVSLTIEDNGVGFEPGAAMTGNYGHFGLRGIRTRAAKIEGDLRIESRPGSGTTVSIVVPLGQHSVCENEYDPTQLENTYPVG